MSAKYATSRPGTWSGWLVVRPDGYPVAECTFEEVARGVAAALNARHGIPESASAATLLDKFNRPPTKEHITLWEAFEVQS